MESVQASHRGIFASISLVLLIQPTRVRIWLLVNLTWVPLLVPQVRNDAKGWINLSAKSNQNVYWITLPRQWRKLRNLIGIYDTTREMMVFFRVLGWDRSKLGELFKNSSNSTKTGVTSWMNFFCPVDKLEFRWSWRRPHWWPHPADNFPSSFFIKARGWMSLKIVELEPSPSFDCQTRWLVI